MERVLASRRATFAKYYKPLADLPRTQALFARLVNIPTHPDMAQLDDRELAEEIQGLARVSLQTAR